MDDMDDFVPFSGPGFRLGEIAADSAHMVIEENAKQKDVTYDNEGARMQQGRGATAEEATSMLDGMGISDVASSSGLRTAEPGPIVQVKQEPPTQ